jgi:hypothetical protein
MKKLLLTVVLAGGAMIAMQVPSATPASAFGWCGWWGGCCKVRHYRACACGCKARVVRYYRRARCGCC